MLHEKEKVTFKIEYINLYNCNYKFELNILIWMLKKYQQKSAQSLTLHSY